MRKKLAEKLGIRDFQFPFIFKGESAFTAK